MKSNSKFEESVRFVTRHYDPEAFDADRDAKEVFPRKPLRRRLMTAAASAAVVFGVAAAIWVLHTPAPGHDTPAETAVEHTVEAPSKEIKRIEFTDAPLTDVAAEIEAVYGVKVTNLPASNPKLTLSYEGTAADLVETVNELLGTELMIEEAR